MHTREKLISARVSMLALADQLQNVSRAWSKEYPTYSYVRIAEQLKLIGAPASASQVRGV